MPSRQELEGDARIHVDLLAIRSQSTIIRSWRSTRKVHARFARMGLSGRCTWRSSAVGAGCWVIPLAMRELAGRRSPANACPCMRLSGSSISPQRSGAPGGVVPAPCRPSTKVSVPSSSDRRRANSSRCCGVLAQVGRRVVVGSPQQVQFQRPMRSAPHQRSVERNVPLLNGKRGRCCSRRLRASRSSSICIAFLHLQADRATRGCRVIAQPGPGARFEAALNTRVRGTAGDTAARLRRLRPKISQVQQLIAAQRSPAHRDNGSLADGHIITASGSPPAGMSTRRARCRNACPCCSAPSAAPIVLGDVDAGEVARFRRCRSKAVDNRLSGVPRQRSRCRPRPRRSPSRISTVMARY